MTTVVLDLEWNGARYGEQGSFFNEIIEIGAVELDGDMRPAERFHRVIRPRLCTRLTRLVQNLTHITPRELEADGVSFEEAMADFFAFTGDEMILLTWSTTDLLVLTENFGVLKGEQTVPHMVGYADIQRYCQERMKADPSQQMSLANACEVLGIQPEETALHRAPLDAYLTALVFSELYECASYERCVRQVDEHFYPRLLFKPVFIADIQSELMPKDALIFSCPSCGRNLRRKGKWRFSHGSFTADFQCRLCQKNFTGRVQAKQTYDDVEVRRKLIEKSPAAKEE